VLDSPHLQPSLRRDFTFTLHKLCELCDILPSSHVISDALNREDNEPKYSGGFADVYQGTYKGELVAIKSLRVQYARDWTTFRRVHSRILTISRISNSFQPSYSTRRYFCGSRYPMRASSHSWDPNIRHPHSLSNSYLLG